MTPVPKVKVITVDELREQLGMDPIEFRLLNGSHEGPRQIAGPRLPRIVASILGSG